MKINQKLSDYAYDGYVPVDHRIVGLVSCEDHYSHALFRNIVMNIKWDLLWYRKENQEVVCLPRLGEESLQFELPHRI